MIFYLVRHGDVPFEPGDPGLTALGRAQAAAAGDWLADKHIAAVYASPLRRAKETARIIAARISATRISAARISTAQGTDGGRSGELPVMIDPRLRERLNWGDMEDQNWAEFAAEWERASADRDYIPPGGQSAHQAAQALASFLQDSAQLDIQGAAQPEIQGAAQPDMQDSTQPTRQDADAPSGEAPEADPGRPGEANAPWQALQDTPQLTPEDTALLAEMGRQRAERGVVVVAHAGIISDYLIDYLPAAALTALNPDWPRRPSGLITHASITVLRYDADGPRVEALAIPAKVDARG